MDSFGLGTVGLAAFLYLLAAGEQKGTNGLLARTTIDIAMVILEREWRKTGAAAVGAPFEKSVEGLLPRLEMDARGIRNHAIEIEGYGIELRWSETGFARHGSAHGARLWNCESAMRRSI